MHDPQPLKGLRVLVVDDDGDARDLAAMVLTVAGAEVEESGAADRALARAHEASFDVVLCDVSMPEMDGLTFVRALKSDAATSRVRAVALTAFCSDDDKRTALEAGFDRHLGKIGDTEALVRAVADVATSSR